MKFFIFVFLIGLFTLCFISFIIWYVLYRNHLVSFGYMPKKSKDIFDEKFAHRGLHFCYPENTLKAIELAVNNNMAVEFDLRLTKDGKIVLFHDRYTKRLLGIPGKLSKMTVKKIKKYYVLKSDEKVPTLKEVLTSINGRSTVLIEIKSPFNKQFRKELLKCLYEYNHFETIYFHTKSIYNYFILRLIFGDRVFFVANLFRKRFNYIKGGDYKHVIRHIKSASTFVNTSYLDTNTIEPFSLDDIAQVITEDIEENDTVQEIIAKISEAINKQTSRITKDDPIKKWPIAHRGIVSNKYPENSKEAIEECVRFAILHNTGIVIELDMQLYKGKVVLYHDDSKSNLLGQAKSCATKIPISKALTLEDLLEIELVKLHKDKIAFIFDDKSIRKGKAELQIKASKVFKKMLKQNYNFYVQAANPFVLNWYHRNISMVKRGMVGNSVPSIRTIVLRLRNSKKARVFADLVRQAIAFIWFDLAESDYCVYDYSNYIYVFMKYCKGFRGKTVLIYAPKSLEEIENMIGNELVDAYIMENISDSNAWPSEYMKKRFVSFTA